MFEKMKGLISMNLKNILNKVEKKRGVATVLSLLSIIGGSMPVSGATDDIQKQAEKKSNIQQNGNDISSLSDIIFGLECLTFGAILMKIYDSNVSSKERLFTSEAQEVFKEIENFKNYVSKNLNESQSLMVLFDRLYGLNNPCDDTELVDLVKKICVKFNKLIERVNSEFQKEFEFIGDYSSELKDDLNKYNCPFSFLSAIRFQISYILKYIPSTENMNQPSISHDLLILYNLFVKMDSVEFYKI